MKLPSTCAALQRDHVPT